MAAVDGRELPEAVECSPDAQDRAEDAADRWTRWVWPAAYAMAAALLFLAYYRLSETMPVTSDGSTITLQAWDMLHGNWLLHGWTLADVSFYTTELPEYILVEILRGLGPWDVHTSAAITYTLLVVLAGLVAKGTATGLEGLVRVLIAAGIMIAPQVGHGVFILLLAPDHIGTGVPVFATWLVLDRAPRRWWVPPLICLMLTWTLAGDRVALLTAVAPLALVAATRVYQAVLQRRQPVRDSWFELALVAAAIVADALSTLIVAVLRHLGGGTLQPVPSAFSTVSGMTTHFWWTVQGVLALFGADVFTLRLNAATGLVLLHLVGLTLAVIAVYRGVRDFLRNDDLLVGVLTAAVLINLGVYLFSGLAQTIWSAREIAGILPAAAVLAGRTLAGPVIGKRLLPLLGAVGLGYLVALGYGITRPQQPAEGQDLAGWLQAHHLSYGLSGYGFGPTTTLASGGTVQLRQATWLADRVAEGPEEWDTSWYKPNAHYADFVVVPVTPGPSDPLTQAQVTRIFGTPTHVYHFTSQFIIMTWNKNLLNEVSP